MTNYNERLDEILADHREWMRGIRTDRLVGTSSEDTKQAINSLTKELVEEAKPEVKAHPLGPVTLADCQRGLDHYEANLLKALEEV